MMMRTKTKPRIPKSKNQQEEFYNGVRLFSSFYRQNPHRLAVDYFGLSLYPFQLILLYLMDKYTFFLWIASRGIGKSYLISIYCIIRAVLYPNSLIVVAAGTKGQAKLIVTQKIVKELMKSEAIKREIKKVETGANEARVQFWNGSTIECVTSSDNSRGYRSHVLVLDEYRMIKKEVLDSVLRKFNAAPRKPPYMFKKEYSHLKPHKNKELYISSAWYKSSWAYEKFISYRNAMCKGKPYFCCDLPYTVPLEHGLLDEDTVRDIRNEEDMDEISWAMEMEGKWYGESSSSYFKSAEINPLRTLTRAFYPPTETEWIQLKGKYKSNILKLKNEKRIIGCDIALAAGAQNDNSVYTLLRMLPDGNEYRREVVYIESHNGVNSEKQAIRIKQLFYDFEADYIIIDSQGVGISVFNELQKSNYDNSRNKDYEAFTCFNDDNTVDKIMARGALPVIYSLKPASASINHNIIHSFKDAILKKKIKFLMNNSEAKNELIDDNNDLLKNQEELAKLLKPYMQTTLLVNETINLEWSLNGGHIKVFEKGNARKDRYSSCSYANYLADLIEKEEFKKKKRGDSKMKPLW